MADFPETVITTHHIQHVYVGSPDFVDGEFTYQHEKRLRAGSHLQKLHHSPKMDEVGIWIIRIRDFTIVPIVYSPLWGNRFPNRQGIDRDFDEVEKLANCMESFKKLPETDRVAFLKAKSESTCPQIGYWAVDTIGSYPKKDGLEILKQLIGNSKVSVGGQVALDKALWKYDAPHWQHSDTRFNMLHEWTKGHLSNFEEIWVDYRLSEIMRNSSLYGFPEQKQEVLRKDLFERFRPGRK